MAYSVAWNEAVPAGTSAANLIATFITNDKIAVRERIDDVFGTSALTSLDTADPYLISIIKMGATAVSKIIPGATSISLRDSADAADNFLVRENGDSDLRGYLDIAKTASVGILNAGAVTGGGGLTVDLSEGNVIDISVSEALTTLTLNNPMVGAFYTFRLTYAGNFDVTWPATFEWPESTAPTLTKVNLKTDIITAMWDGTRYTAVPVGFNYTF